MNYLKAIHKGYCAYRLTYIHNMCRYYNVKEDQVSSLLKMWAT